MDVTPPQHIVLPIAAFSGDIGLHSEGTLEHRSLTQGGFVPRSREGTFVVKPRPRDEAKLSRGMARTLDY